MFGWNRPNQWQQDNKAGQPKKWEVWQLLDLVSPGDIPTPHTENFITSTCGQRVEHDKTGCKNIICPRCQVEFCFVCLKLTRKCLETSSYFIPCSDGVAPRQTSIPVWHRI